MLYASHLWLLGIIYIQGSDTDLRVNAGLSILHAQQVWQDDLGGRAVVSTRPYREILEQDPDALRLPRVQGQYAGSLDRDSTLQSTKGEMG